VRVRPQLRTAIPEEQGIVRDLNRIPRFAKNSPEQKTGRSRL
jgi:hypothetical protein